MRLAEMGLNSRIECTTDLGIRDIDRNHDWINEGKQNYSVTDIAMAGNFVRQSSNNARDNQREKINDIIEYQSLNENQKKVFKKIKTHFNNILMRKEVAPLRIIVMGTAGTGKSYLIKAIRGQLCRMAGAGSKSPILVIAPTGVAAFNINGSTIHSALSIPILKENNDELNGEKLKQLQDRLQNVTYLIIDEKSMVGR